jgi:hypothetical protein
MILYTVIEKAPYSACVLDILNQLDSVRAVFAAAKDLPGGARAASGWVSPFVSLIRDVIDERRSLRFKVSAQHPVP